MASGEVLNIELTDGVIDLKIDRNTVRIDSASFYNEDNYVTLKGKIDLLEDYLSIYLHDFVFQYQDYRIFSKDSLIAFLQQDSLIIEDLVLNATGQGEIEVRGMYDFEGESGLGVYFKDIQLLPFNQFIQMEYPMAGIVDISVILSGSPDSLNVEGLMEMRNLIFGEDSIGNVWSNFNYSNNEIEIEKFDFIHSPESYFSLSGNIKLPSKKLSTEKLKIISNERINLQMNFKNIKLGDYPFFSDRNYPFDGIFSGDLDVRGTVRNFNGTYMLNAQNFQYREYEVESIDLNGTMLPEGIVLERGMVNFQGTSIRISGQKPLNWNYQNIKDIFSDKSFNLKVAIKDDSLKFLNVLTPEIDLLVGDINIHMDIGGTFDSPKLINGLMEISDGILYLSKVENPLEEVQFSAVVEKEVFRIKKCKAKTSGYVENTGFLSSVTDVLLYPIRKLFLGQQARNEISVTGEIDFSNLIKPDINFKLSANQIYINYFLENTELLLSTNNFAISGRDTLSITGDVVIHKGEVDLDLKESEKNLLLISNVREKTPYLQYHLSVSIPGNFYIRSEALFNSFDMMLMGDLQIIQEPKGLLEIYGNLEVPKGKYFQFEEFRIRNGRIEFINPKELPKLNIFAEKNKYGYLFQLHVEGYLNNPIKEIRIFDPNTREDITHLYPETKDQIALLLFGMTFNEIGGSAGSVALDKGQEVINKAIISKIEQEARRFIGLDEIRVESEGGLIDFTNLRLNQMSQNSAISLGKYLMPNLYVEYKTQLGTSGVSTLGGASSPKLDYEVGNQVFLEYRINRNWSVSSFYAKQLYDKFKIDISWRYAF
jgi:hypothetical protein